MADKELVVRINEYTYYRFIDGFADEDDAVLIEELFKNAAPLPKGHGDLIDRSEVIKSLFDYHNGKKTIGQCIDDVQTIIEADKGEE